MRDEFECGMRRQLVSCEFSPLVTQPRIPDSSSALCIGSKFRISHPSRHSYLIFQPFASVAADFRPCPGTMYSSVCGRCGKFMKPTAFNLQSSRIS
jgi:hypothetical protein